MLVDFYSDGATLAKSRSHCAPFIRVLFSNIDACSESLFTVFIAPNTKAIPPEVPGKNRRKMQLNLMQWFIFTIFKKIITASHNGTVSDAVLLFSRISMIASYQPEDRTLLCLLNALISMTVAYFLCRRQCQSNRYPLN